MTNKTNLGLVQWCHGLLGQAYWFGCCCYDATESLLNRKAQQYPSHYKENRMARYRADIKAKKKVADCCGLIKGYYWTRDDGTMKYGLDGRPDKGASGLYNAAKVKGPIATLPEIPGLLLHSPGHVGVYIGGGWAIEARGFAYGIVKTRVSERKWTSWSQCPYIDYVDGEAELPTPEPEAPAGPRTLRHIPGSLMRGDDVRHAQTRLAVLGFAPGTIDGIYGPKTEAAVKSFQQAYWLEVNGCVDSKTWAALEKTPEAAAPEEAQTPETNPEETKPDAGAPVAPPGGNRLYTVKRGDTLWGIARTHLGQGARYREIMALNGLSSDLIRDGMVLKLP